MTKKEFLSKVRELYKAMNMADSDHNPPRSKWMNPEMAGQDGCAHLDAMLYAMNERGTLTADEHQKFYDTL